MALKKPSDIFNKTEPSGVFNIPEVSSNITETYNRFRDNLDKVNVLSEQIEQLKHQLSEKMTRTDLENAMYSQLMILDENFKSIQNQVKGLNKEDLKEFKINISNLTEIVGNLVENELPKYKKQVTKNEVVIDEKFNEFIVGIRNEIDTKVNDIAEVIDTNLEYFNTQLQETSSETKNTSDTYNKLSKIVENRILKENNKLDEYSQVIQSLHKSFVELEKSLQEKTSTHQQVIEEVIVEKFQTISSDINNKIDSIDEDVDTFKNQVSSDISSIKADVVIFEKHNKDTEKTIQEFSEQLYKISEIDEDIININEDIGKLQNQYDSISNQSIETKKDLEVVERYIQNHHQKLVELKEEVFGEIEQIQVGNIQENLERLEKKIDFIKETYSKIEPEVIVKEVIKEGLLNEPPDTKNSDPLTPLDQNFVTLDQLQKHYSLFINRIQQQLSTLGGGGETRLKYLDDIVGIATNASAYDGKFLKYDHNIGKFIFDATGGGNLDATLQLGNTSSLGMSVGVVTATQFVGPLTGNASSASTAGTATTATNLADANNILTGTINKDRISTTNALTILGGAYVSGSVGIGTTNPTQSLHVLGNARVTGAVFASDVNGISTSGTSGQVLQSTGIGISWVTSGGGATLSNDTTTNATYYPTFSSAISGTYSTAYVSNTKCTFNPSTGTLSATVFASLSDETQKTDIQPIENAISIVKQLQGVKYKWINDHNQPSIGVIAQEVEKVLPEVVSTNDDGLKSVSYGNIIGVLIEAIKEQQVCIEELKKKLNS